MDHIPDEALERYAMGKLPDSEIASLEEHLLICHDCQVRLDAMDEYVAAMRAAAAKLVDAGDVGDAA